MYATITSDNIFRSFNVDAIIYTCGPIIMDASLVLEDFFREVQDFAYNLRFKLSFIVIFFWMVHKEKLFRRSSVKYRSFSQGPT